MYLFIAVWLFLMYLVMCQAFTEGLPRVPKQFCSYSPVFKDEAWFYTLNNRLKYRLEHSWKCIALEVTK